MSTELQELLDSNKQWAADTETREPGFFSRLLKQQTPAIPVDRLCRQPGPGQ